MRWVLQIALAMTALVFAACGERVPLQTTTKTDMFAGSWINSEDLKNNIDAENGGKQKITVLTVSSINLEVTEEIRDPSKKKEDVIAYPVGRLKATMVPGKGQIVYDVAQMKKQTEKVSTRSEEEIQKLAKTNVMMSVRLDRKTATLEHRVDVKAEKGEVTEFVKLSPEDREKLNLPAAPKKEVTPETKPAKAN